MGNQAAGNGCLREMKPEMQNCERAVKEMVLEVDCTECHEPVFDEMVMTADDHVNLVQSGWMQKNVITSFEASLAALEQKKQATVALEAQLASLEQAKLHAAANEDYDAAKHYKQEIERIQALLADPDTVLCKGIGTSSPASKAKAKRVQWRTDSQAQDKAYSHLVGAYAPQRKEPEAKSFACATKTQASVGACAPQRMESDSVVGKSFACATKTQASVGACAPQHTASESLVGKSFACATKAQAPVGAWTTQHMESESLVGKSFACVPQGRMLVVKS